MELAFLGGATTVTGSQFLLDTGRARVLIDCGMFQGSPNETVRNRLPFGFEPRQVDAVLLTHAHLDHCGLIPHLVASGFAGPIHATDGTVEQGVTARFVDAGHILGSAIIVVRAEGRTIVFSGDLGRRGSPIVRDPSVVTDADYVLMESTYGGREHQPESQATAILAETVK